MALGIVRGRGLNVGCCAPGNGGVAAAVVAATRVVPPLVGGGIALASPGPSPRRLRAASRFARAAPAAAASSRRRRARRRDALRHSFFSPSRCRTRARRPAFTSLQVGSSTPPWSRPSPAREARRLAAAQRAYPPPSRRSVSAVTRSSNACSGRLFAAFRPKREKAFLRSPVRPSAGLRSVSASQKRAARARRRGEQLSERRRRRRRLHLGDGARLPRDARRRAAASAPVAPPRLLDVLRRSRAARTARSPRAAQLPGHEAPSISPLLLSPSPPRPRRRPTRTRPPRRASRARRRPERAHRARRELTPRGPSPPSASAPPSTPGAYSNRRRARPRGRASRGRLRFSNRGRPWMYLVDAPRFCSRPEYVQKFEAPRARAGPSMA